MPEYDVFYKDPLAVRKLTLPYASRLGEDTIASSEWIPETGITVPTDSSAAQSATGFISGGTEGETYLVTNRITTGGGQVIDRTVRFIVQRDWRSLAMDVDSTIDLPVDWQLWLDGETTLTDSEWQSDAGISVSDLGIHDDTVTLARLTALQASETPGVLNVVTAADGQIDVAAFRVYPKAL